MDGGAGMAGAMGIKFMDKDGKEVPLTPRGLESLSSIDANGIPNELGETEFPDRKRRAERFVGSMALQMYLESKRARTAGRSCR